MLFIEKSKFEIELKLDLKFIKTITLECSSEEEAIEEINNILKCGLDRLKECSTLEDMNNIYLIKSKICKIKEIV